MALQRTRGLSAAQVLWSAGSRSASQALLGGRSPLNAVALDGRRTWLIVLAFLLPACSSLGADAGGISLQLAGPSRASVGKPLKLRFTVANTGRTGVYFKQPWKWAVNGLHVVAMSADGARQGSTSVIADIDAKYLCIYFKPLASADRFSFEETLRVGRVPDESSASFAEMAFLPHLELRPGQYKLQWVYEPKLYPDESACAAAGWRIWSGRAESNEIPLTVE